MSDYADLVRRLRDFPLFVLNGAIWLRCVEKEPLCIEAADAIEAQARQLAAPLPEEVEAMSKRLLTNTAVSGIDLIAAESMLRSLARQVAEKDADLEAALNGAGSIVGNVTDAACASMDAWKQRAERAEAALTEFMDVCAYAETDVLKQGIRRAYYKGRGVLSAVKERRCE